MLYCVLSAVAIALALGHEQTEFDFDDAKMDVQQMRSSQMPPPAVSAASVFPQSTIFASSMMAPPRPFSMGVPASSMGFPPASSWNSPPVRASSLGIPPVRFSSMGQAMPPALSSMSLGSVGQWNSNWAFNGTSQTPPPPPVTPPRTNSTTPASGSNTTRPPNTTNTTQPISPRPANTTTPNTTNTTQPISPRPANTTTTNTTNTTQPLAPRPPNTTNTTNTTKPPAPVPTNTTQPVNPPPRPPMPNGTNWNPMINGTNTTRPMYGNTTRGNGTNWAPMMGNGTRDPFVSAILGMLGTNNTTALSQTAQNLSKVLEFAVNNPAMVSGALNNPVTTANLVGTMLGNPGAASNISSIIQTIQKANATMNGNNTVLTDVMTAVSNNKELSQLLNGVVGAMNNATPQEITRIVQGRMPMGNNTGNRTLTPAQSPVSSPSSVPSGSVNVPAGNWSAVTNAMEQIKAINSTAVQQAFNTSTLAPFIAEASAFVQKTGLNATSVAQALDCSEMYLGVCLMARTNCTSADCLAQNLTSVCKSVCAAPMVALQAAATRSNCTNSSALWSCMDKVMQATNCSNITCTTTAQPVAPPKNTTGCTDCAPKDDDKPKIPVKTIAIAAGAALAGLSAVGLIYKFISAKRAAAAAANAYGKGSPNMMEHAEMNDVEQAEEYQNEWQYSDHQNSYNDDENMDVESGAPSDVSASNSMTAASNYSTDAR